MPKTTALMILIFSSSSYGASLNLIASDDVKINGAKVVYLNQNVLFFSEQLSVYDTNTGQFKNTDFEFGFNEPEDSGHVTGFYNVLQLGNHVYFTVEIDQAYAGIWRTNGTVEGTHLFSSELVGSLTKINGFLLGAHADNKIWVTDGNSTYIHDDIESWQHRLICVFAVDHIVFTDNFLPLTRSQQGTITEFDVPMSWSINPTYPVFTQTRDDCFVEAVIRGNASLERKLFRIPRTGSVSVLTDIPALENVNHVYAFNSRIIAETSDRLLHLTDDLQGVDASIPLPSEEVYHTGPVPQAGRTLFQLRSRPVGSGSGAADTLYDFNLNQSIEFESNSYTIDAAVLSTSEAEHFFHYKAPSDQQNKTGRLWLDVFKSNQSFLDFAANQDIFIINNPNQTRLYALVTNDQAQTSAFYQVVDDLEINSLITGGWHDPNIRNQGLNIRKGTRHNGSEYVIATVYTYRDGQPLWLAGMAELNLPQQTIGMALSEYDGIGLFEVGITPNQNVFGNLELKLTSCHTLSATITTADDSFDLNLHRLDDVTFTQNCVD